METIENVLNGACDDGRADLKAFAETGDLDALARVHTESCPACEQAADALIGLRAAAPGAEKPGFPRRLSFAARFAVGMVLIVGFAGTLAGISMVFISALRSDAPSASELDALQARIRYVRMPGRPDVCVAAVQGTGGFGPTTYGAARCKDVRDRVEFDEEIAWSLREFAVVRIRGTDTCLATDGKENSFTLPCSSDD